MPPELLEIIRSGGAALAPLLGVLWWLERAERKELAEKLQDIGVENMQAITETKAALRALEGVFNGRRGRDQ